MWLKTAREISPKVLREENRGAPTRFSAHIPEMTTCCSDILAWEWYLWTLSTETSLISSLPFLPGVSVEETGSAPRHDAAGVRSGAAAGKGDWREVSTGLEERSAKTPPSAALESHGLLVPLCATVRRQWRSEVIGNRRF